MRSVMTVVDQSALEHYMTLYLEFKFIVRHMKNRIVYDTKVRLYLKKLRRMPVRHTWRANLPELNCGVCFSACAVGQCGIGEKS